MSGTRVSITFLEVSPLFPICPAVSFWSRYYTIRWELSFEHFSTTVREMYVSLSGDRGRIEPWLLIRKL